MIMSPEDMTCEVRLKELSLFNLAKRKLRRALLGTKSDLKDNYKDDGAKFFLVIADVTRRDNGYKLQTGRFQLDIKKTENLPEGIPCPIIIAWAIGKLYYENEQCWFGKEPGKYIDYIYQGPVILVLLINFVFLFNIVRILMTKLRASTTSETIQYRKAVKATLVLLPLLGITYMLFFVNPGEDDISQIVFIYFNSFLQSFQGFFVSVFYCFLNGEVRSAARKRWHRWQDHHSLRVRVARAMSIPTSPTRISFHSIKQTAAV
ncbi:corticotropin-releasing factor receptor 2 [Grus japonensis]|uniref:Corticotropin-releasing factor receptor 2 n=1 Tax=Grus japonensis TaxID=30415 RepID=A0ABC9WJN3_GRUJA